LNVKVSKHHLAKVSSLKVHNFNFFTYTF